ncbi:biotin/lipoate protein ligase-like protein [Leptomonas pyrrhocoris]|uniref:Biotin/lipoate protein ligase-like protein n=1 Tax=Leptomonas pyrrhocoris TaxID=157538 RepID=A0A0M9FZB2_LEPPY|nr:biotin/lipoate protein ligase-like protein [Leptomonas pyrrhocoris]KPA78946.1 biotin/lipoate protein ligase-like protein [Leptomonas pyrrhocoris]|eukprot:XP_015657385.1 biotin/lipoate protein ligase-like protein [Leptomonas pyrrhocoris]
MPSLFPVNIRFLEEVGSTMEVGREMIAAAAGKPFGVVAGMQTAGRGTGGRTWTSPKGNMYFTLCVPHNEKAACFKEELVPVMPLVCGLACRRAVLEVLHLDAASASASVAAEAAKAVSTKWPNDLIFRHKKIGGTLIENEDGYLLIGMGMNVAVGPKVTDAGREATTINEIADEFGVKHVDPKDLANAIWVHFFDICNADGVTRASIVADFDKVIDKSLKLHKRLPDGRDPEELTAVSLNSWGHLTVRHADGSTEDLAAEYLF